MIISKYTPLNVIKIRAPRYHDMKVLPAVYKVKEHNKIVIEHGARQGEYYMKGKDMRTYPVTTNGKISVYEIPLDDLETLEYKEDVSKIAKELFND